MKLPTAVKLARSYDPERLLQDLERVAAFKMARQPGPYHDGRWKGIALVNAGGDAENAGVGKEGLFQPIAPTEALALTPYFAEILDAIPGKKYTVRLLELPAGATIEDHADTHFTVQQSRLRLHVPIATHELVTTTIGGEVWHWAAGELWFGDFSRTHRVDNRSDIRRVHMVIDVDIVEETLALFPHDVAKQIVASGGVRRALSREAFERLRCAFTIPDGIHPDLTGQRAETAFDGQGFYLLVGGQKLSELIAIEEARFRLADLPVEAELQFQLGGDQVEAVGIRLTTWLPAEPVLGSRS